MGTALRILKSKKGSRRLPVCLERLSWDVDGWMEGMADIL